MSNKVLALKNAGRLTCAWLPTGDPRHPLTCVWTVDSRSAAKAASSTKTDSGRMLACA
jgi:hypothetical protein